jgi:leader peptidase (prepilin peptidase)/N-methyltransferase
MLLAVVLFVVGCGAGVLAAAVADRETAAGARPKPARGMWNPVRLVSAALVTGALFVATPGVVGSSWVLPAYLWFVWVTVTLTITDLEARLIPNRVLFPGTAVGLALLGAGALGDGTAAAFVRGILGAAAVFLLLYLVARLARGAFGLGDVKLGFLLGLFTGYQGWAEVVVALFVAFALGGVVSMFLLAARLRRRKDAIPFGPYLVAGAYIALAAGQTIADWYVDG